MINSRYLRYEFKPGPAALNFINMKLFPLFCAAMLLGISACQSPTPQETPKADTPVAEAPAAPATPAVEDPDPTDNTPGDQYNPNTTSKQTADLVRSVLQAQLKADLDKNLVDSLSRKFVFFEYDLNDDGQKEIFVGLTGPYFCGSGGCSPMLLDSQGKVITKFSVSEYPIVVDNAKTNGWKDLFIQSGAKHHILKFDGKKYPSNPSVQKALGTIPGDGLTRVLDFVNSSYPRFSF